ncbi:hypothetical protein ACFX2F_030041 [Malus domestica]
MEEQNFTDYFPQTPLANSEPANATETFMESSTMNLGSNEVNGMKLLLESADEIGVRLEFDGDKTGVRFESDGDEHGMKKYKENESRAAKEGLKETGRDIVVFGNNNGSATRPIILDSNNTNSKGKGKKIEHDDADSIAIIPNPSTLSHLSTETLPKRKRGRPKGSSNKLKPFASTGGFPVYPALGELMPHILTVKLGENILSQLLLLSQSTNRAMCILSAVGVVSIVCISKLSGSYLRFKGPFQILSLSGTFVYGSMRNPLEKSWMINVLLANHDGKAFGGSVAGFMIAAEPVQIVVGSFEQGTRKERKKSRRARSSYPSRLPGNGGITRATPLIMIPPKAKNDGICTSPASALLETPANSGSGHLIGANSINPASLPSFGQNVNPAPLSGFGQNVNPASPPDFGQNNVPQSMLGPGTSIDFIPFVP